MDNLTQGSRGEHLKLVALVVLVVLGLYLASLTVAEVQGWRYVGAGLPPTNTITVSGFGEVFAVPDLATFSFTVLERAATVAAAQKTATEKINEAIDYLKDQGIEEKDIKTISYNAYPQYEWEQVVCADIRYPCPAGKQVITGYEVSQSVSVKVRDTEKAGDLLTGVGDTGISNISGIDFTLDDDDAIKAEARAKAIADAKEKAEVLADTLGVRLVRITAFYESDGGIIYYGRGGALDAVAESVKGAPAPQLPPGENQFTSNVNVTYEIR